MPGASRDSSDDSSPAACHGASTSGNRSSEQREGVEQVPGPGPLAQVEEQRRVGVGLVGGGHAGERVQDHVARLQEAVGGRERSPARMLAQPQDLRADVERGGDVPGARVHRLCRRRARASALASAVARLSRYSRPGPSGRRSRSNGAIVGHWPVRPIARTDAARTLGSGGQLRGARRAPRRASRGDPARPSPVGESRSRRGAGPRRTHRPPQVDGRRARSGGADVDGDEQGIVGHHPRTS